jgi:hypothetical protein
MFIDRSWGWGEWWTTLGESGPSQYGKGLRGFAMTNPSIVAGLGKKSGSTLSRMASLTRLAPRRTGVDLWSQSVDGERLRQPQDGASPLRAKLATITAHLQGDLFQEPEDARLTGGTRSLARRLLGLNLGSKSGKVPVMGVGTLAQPKVA